MIILYLQLFLFFSFLFLKKHRNAFKLSKGKISDEYDNCYPYSLIGISSCSPTCETSTLHRKKKNGNYCALIYKCFNVDVSKYSCYLLFLLTDPLPTLDHYWEVSPTNPMLITAWYWFWPKGQQEPKIKVGSLSSVECLFSSNKDNIKIMPEKVIRWVIPEDVLC